MEPGVTQAMKDYANFMELYVEPALLVIHYLAVTIGPVIATLLNVVIGLVRWFIGIEGTFQFDSLPLIG